VDEILSASPESEPQIIGIRENRVTRSPLMACVEQTHKVAEVIKAKDYEKAMDMRGGSFKEAYRNFRTLVRALPHPPQPDQKRLRLAILNAGGPAAGMNTAVRAAARLAMDRGHIVLTVRNGFEGLIEGKVDEISWMNVAGWSSRGGAELGTSRKVPTGGEFYVLAREIEKHGIQGILMIGGSDGYDAAYQIFTRRNEFPTFNIPIICLPATINNNLPGSELSIGSDTALNNIVDAVDKIKQSAVATRRCFVVEVMGRYCGYLALMSGLATGAERVYLHEEGVTLKDLQTDLENLIAGFKNDKRLGLMIRSENANPLYTTGFMCALFEEEGGHLFDVRQAILGHQQQGGDPTPFDRIQATRLAAKCVEFLIEEGQKPNPASAFIGLQSGRVQITPMERYPQMVDPKFHRPVNQWWLELRHIARLMAQPGPQAPAPKA
jgi:6-phosphofructokinase 1